MKASSFFEKTAEKLRGRMKAVLGDEKKTINFLVVLGVAGMALLALSEWLPAAKPERAGTAEPVQAQQAAGTESYAQELEERLCRLLGQVDGAGRIQVMVTLESSRQTVYAKDVEQRSDGSRTEQHIPTEGTADPALVETVELPLVQGVAVVCDGGEDPAVQGKITQIVSALMGIGTNRVSIAKMADANG